mmetsp:Transcript_3030/g.6297  ORF Transcript_3030/g.6297 Transcript_3030/m.6297 type:complete len:239 (-) Transcript_3030:221-937(-)|eukprot:CAMPEP_0172527276 /NCGR_PEP_ID=MMETSP1067-20121228/2005_1 /TAXON_ID=265564 ORGANISM="Thalassiosira punctigera, Strain Tpunct2005C2" /NCGR_SAMPLE_ID=MMETSP1067 /ASSEMBLY_ACC=CAM_ASM_000444 /LENGTH=238 /DNA_ID=CAMNT_0013310985 /DNA_START=136 /DNA_END=852 /DNA_ORIENTATION=-
MGKGFLSRSFSNSKGNNASSSHRFSFTKSSGNSTNQTKNKATKRRVSFADIAAKRHEYDFDWELEPVYWFSRDELKSFNEVRFDEADVLRSARGIKTSSRNDADNLDGSGRDVYIGDKITNALDDIDDDHEISVRGIEHFVFPVLQKEMIRRKKDLKRTVLGYSRDPKVRRMDPKGIKLAQQTISLSQWARDVATERGIKYCEMKRGGGRGGGLLGAAKLSKCSTAKRRLSLCEKMEE